MATALLLVVPLAAGCGRSAGDAKQQSEQPAPADSGVVVLDARAAREAGLVVAAAGAERIDVILDVPGEVRADPQRVLEVRPRFAGVVHDLFKAVGQPVRRGDLLAKIESNESLTLYPVTASIGGRVLARPAVLGQSVTPETSLFTIADLSIVWVELGVYPNQLALVRKGNTAHVVAATDSTRVQDGIIADVAPTLDSEARVAVARIVLPNPAGRWQPGMFANVSVTVEHITAPIAVPEDAVVRTSEGPAVFVAEGTRYRRQTVTTGRDDGRHVQIVAGLPAGALVVARNAFVLQSELEKSASEE
jgi:cobalt-zinc-cadmium efflux system membrane fusion protein